MPSPFTESLLYIVFCWIVQIKFRHSQSFSFQPFKIIFSKVKSANIEGKHWKRLNKMYVHWSLVCKFPSFFTCLTWHTALALQIFFKDRIDNILSSFSNQSSLKHNHNSITVENSIDCINTLWKQSMIFFLNSFNRETSHSNQSNSIFQTPIMHLRKSIET
jgi:hypothetical protein